MRRPRPLTLAHDRPLQLDRDQPLFRAIRKKVGKKTPTCPERCETCGGRQFLEVAGQWCCVACLSGDNLPPVDPFDLSEGEGL